MDHLKVELRTMEMVHSSIAEGRLGEKLMAVTLVLYLLRKAASNWLNSYCCNFNYGINQSVYTLPVSDTLFLFEPSMESYKMKGMDKLMEEGFQKVQTNRRYTM